MKRILFVTSSLAYSGAARQLSLLAATLPRDRFEVHVCTLGETTPWSADLERAGIPVQALGRRRFFDVLPFLKLRRVLRTVRAEVVHAWDPVALRAAALVTGAHILWASAALPAIGRPGRFDTWLLRRTARLVALCVAEASRYRDMSIPADRIAVIGPAAKLSLDDPSGVEIIPLRGPKWTGPAVVMVGPLSGHKGVRLALWALDILHYLYPELNLLLIGDPPPARELAGLTGVPRVHHLGRCAAVDVILARAELVLVPGRAGGVSAAVEAMAAGKPVVAARTPEMMEIVEENRTGLLFQPGEATDLARQVRVLLDDPAQRRAMGEAARQRAARGFSPALQAERYAEMVETATSLVQGV